MALKKGEQYYICKNIRTNEYTDSDKVNAINDVICGWPTIMSITKDELVEVIRYLLEQCVDDPENVNQKESRCARCRVNKKQEDKCKG